MKKVLAIILCLVMVVSVFTIAPLSTYADETRYFDYRVIGDYSAEITGYTGIANIIDIPSDLDGYTVTSIGDWAFNGYSRMTEVTIPDTVTNIGQGAFWECKGLTKVLIPASVTSISDSAFYDCTSLTRFKVDADNPAYRSLNGDLYDKSAETLIQYASGKTATSFTIPDSVVTVKEGSLIFSCLTEITVSKSVRSIDDYAIGYKYDDNHMPAPIDGFVIKGFVGTAAKLYATDYDITFVALERDPNSVYQYKVLDDGTAEITGYSGDGDEIEIPPTLGGHIVTSIGYNAFYNCSSLSKVTIPDSVTDIGECVFRFCANLKEVIIPDSVKSIGSCALENCWSLTEATIPDSVTVIRTFTFYHCDSLTEVTIPDSVTSIDDLAFGFCTSLTKVTIPDSVTSIGNEVFYQCKSLTEVTIPDSVINIGSHAFGYYYNNGYKKIDGFTIYGNHGTAAEKYAKDNGFTYIAPEVEPGILLGDVDDDQVVGIIDTTYIQRYNAGFRIPVAEEDMLVRGDVDGDCEVGVIDATYIQRYDAGFNTPYPIGEPISKTTN